MITEKIVTIYLEVCSIEQQLPNSLWKATIELHYNKPLTEIKGTFFLKKTPFVDGSKLTRHLR
jgi:hypothetical protein